MSRQTSLICEKCGKIIMSNEGFRASKRLRHILHSPNCKCPMTPNQAKRYTQPDEFRPGFILPTREKETKKKAGYHYA